jgi:hypothetical protein
MVQSICALIALDHAITHAPWPSSPCWYKSGDALFSVSGLEDMTVQSPKLLVLSVGVALNSLSLCEHVAKRPRL